MSQQCRNLSMRRTPSPLGTQYIPGGELTFSAPVTSGGEDNHLCQWLKECSSSQRSKMNSASEEPTGRWHRFFTSCVRRTAVMPHLCGRDEFINEVTFLYQLGQNGERDICNQKSYLYWGLLYHSSKPLSYIISFCPPKPLDMMMFCPHSRKHRLIVVD